MESLTKKSKTNMMQNALTNKVYWINQLAGKLPETNIIADYLRPEVYQGKHKAISFELPNKLSQAVMNFCQGSYLSVYLLLLSVFTILAKKYTENNELIIGIPTYKKEKFENYSNKILPLITNVSEQITFNDLLFQIKDAAIDAYLHQNCAFDELIRLSNLSQSKNRCPIFDIAVLLENIHNYSEIKEFNNDLTISFAINGNTIRGKIDYSESLFRVETINLLAKYYINIVKSVINQPNIKISDIAFLREGDRCQLLEDFNDNLKNYPIHQTINKLFEKQVEHTPNNIAVVYQDTQLTYQKLNEEANQLAVWLQKLGLKKGEFVGIFKDRDINFLIAILAVYKAGGAYVPIDRTYPQGRIEYMLSNSEIRFLLTDSLSLNILSDFLESCAKLEHITCLDVKSQDLVNAKLVKTNIYDKFDFNELPKVNPKIINKANDPAYMLYTSGSTGLPKGAIIRHDGAINHIYAQFDELKLNQEFAFLQSAPASTDISVWQFLAPLLIGGKTVIVDIETVAFAEKLFKVLKSEKVTVIELVPALFKVLLKYTSQLSIHERELPDLQWMILSGESISIKWINKWLEIYPQIKIANAYGPTEAADDIAQFIVDQPVSEKQRTILIGKPLANLNLYILDESMQLLPIGVPGEICVSGIGVGDGYWKNEEKTKLAFVANPFLSKLPSRQTHETIYKTGDLGRWLADGNIEFLGRIDHQVKIRGFRIELGEIEECLSQHSNVGENVVVVREDNPDDKRLVAYVVPVSESHQDNLANQQLVQQLRDFLKEKLPGHMVPSGIVLIEALPLAPSGKVDRQALPIPDFQNESEVGFVAPCTPTEEIVADIWCQILKREKIGIYDDFFDLGGHSLLATQVISRLREAFQIELPVRSLFESPTVDGIIAHIEQIKTVQKLQSISTDLIELTGNREEIEL
ncbi:MAG: non-ribosomal peptide synthetase [Cyanobacteria bacterium P01_A01_bin.40]